MLLAEFVSITNTSYSSVGFLLLFALRDCVVVVDRMFVEHTFRSGYGLM
jgi:hypothetical protein